MADDTALLLIKILSLFGRIRVGEAVELLADCDPAEAAVLQAEMEFAAQAHAGQTRRDNGRPYMDHVLQVWVLIRASGGSLNEQLAALTHDVPEDCEATLKQTKQEILTAIGQRHNAEVQDMVAQLTDPHQNLTFEEKIERAKLLRGGARHIKAADSCCNFYDVLMSPPSSWSTEQVREYVDYRCRMLQAVAPNPPLINAMLAHLLVGMQQQWGSGILPDCC